MDRPAVEDGASAVQVPDEAGDPAFEVEVRLAIDAQVAQPDPQALVEVGRLAQARADRLPREIERFEDLGIRPEEGARAAAPLPAGLEATLLELSQLVPPPAGARISA
jgi:hypothetical protein